MSDLLDGINGSKLIAEIEKTGYSKSISQIEGTNTWRVEGKSGENYWITENGNVVNEVLPQIGDYVEYGIGYTDYESSYNYTSKDGWRILDLGTQNEQGLYTGTKLVSTGLPAHVDASGSQSWFATFSQIIEMKEADSDGEIYIMNGEAAAYGLQLNFESIDFKVKNGNSLSQTAYVSVTKNNTALSGTIKGSDFKTSKASKAGVLTMKEVNNARGEAENSTQNSAYNEPSQGLFNLLAMDSKYGYTSGGYLMATINNSNSSFGNLLAFGRVASPPVMVVGGNSTVNTTPSPAYPIGADYGAIRVVITLNSPIYYDTNSNIWKIQ